MSADVTTHASLLIRLTDESDAAAWREFHQRYADLLRGFARRRGLQPADCDDVVQDVLLSLSKAMPGFAYDAAKGKFRSYLKTVTLRAIFRRSGQNQRHGRLEHIEEATRAASLDEDVEQHWEGEWREHHLRAAMRTISAEFNDQDRQAFQWYAIEGRPVSEVSTLLSMSADAVYQAKSRILKRLAKVIETQVDEEG